MMTDMCLRIECYHSVLRFCPCRAFTVYIPNTRVSLRFTRGYVLLPLLHCLHS